jgi:drug/metabolite transporter (DMT)-like permease
MSALAPRLRSPSSNAPRHPAHVSKINWHAIALLIGLSVIWGASYPLIKVAVAEIPPLTLAAFRITIAAALLHGIVGLRGVTGVAPRPIQWRTIVGIAFWGYALPYSLLAWSEQHISSGEAAILLATIPLLTVFHRGLAFDRSSYHWLLALLPGFCGILVLIGPGGLAGNGSSIGGALVAFAASASFARALLMTARLPPSSPVALAASLLSCAAVMLWPLSLVVEQPWLLAPTAESIAAVLFLGSVGTALALTIYLKLIAVAGAPFAALNNYLAPVSALVIGAALLSEPITRMQIASVSLIFLSIFAMARVRIGGSLSPGTQHETPNAR